jgi:predicted metal-dependent HD superfamily phosphohydrolase
LDIDIGILGQPKDTYNRYVEQVQSEYDFTGKPKFLFGIGRVLFLRNILKRETIFLSNGFQDRFDASARLNLTVELGNRQQELSLMQKLIFKFF